GALGEDVGGKRAAEPPRDELARFRRGLERYEAGGRAAPERQVDRRRLRPLRQRLVADRRDERAPARCRRTVEFGRSRPPVPARARARLVRWIRQALRLE